MCRGLLEAPAPALPGLFILGSLLRTVSWNVPRPLRDGDLLAGAASLALNFWAND